MNPSLDSENPEDPSMYAADGQEDVYYEEPDLSRGVEGVDYEIRYRVEGNESK